MYICPVAGLERMTAGSVVSALPYSATQVDKAKRYDDNNFFSDHTIFIKIFYFSIE